MESNIDVRAVDRWTPPKSESTIGDLVETGALSVRKLLVSHGLLEPGRLLPEQTLPSGEVRPLEQGMLEDTLDTAQSSDDVDTVVVELPQLAIVSLRGPPERIAEINQLEVKKGKICTDTYCLSSWYCFQSVRTRQPRS